jgi:heptaprenyl diphosphate synthase
MNSQLVNLTGTRRLTALSLLAAVGIALFVMETFIPMPLPFLKIGLANISTVLALMMFGAGDMFLVVTIRVLVGSLLTGSLFGPGFLLAIGAGIASAMAMAVVKGVTRKLFSVVGLSLIGAVTHVVTQFLLVLLLYVQNASISFLLPLLLFSALLSGFVVGWISARLVGVLERIYVL